MTAVISLSLIAPLILTVQAVDPSSWYKTVPGVLNSDYYSLYPYETDASLKIGFSKFGELINLNDNTGLEYGAVDPFAPPAGSGLTSQVPKNLWLQGWLINITYTNRLLGPRNVWACAMTSDGIQYGNDWIRVDFMNDRSTTYGKVAHGFQEDPTDPGSLIYGDAPYSTTPSVYGGRKTNGTAVTDPITVLYDGPREFIAVCRTTIYDHPVFQSNDTTGDVPMVQIAITILFNKDYKEVELLKDVKSLLPLKEGDMMKVQFSNRGEVDLGTDAASYASYAHFYTEGKVNFTLPAPQENGQNDTVAEGFPTVYNSSYEERLNAQSSVDTKGATEPTDDPVYTGYSAFGNMPQASGATYDIAQAINPGAGYVWSAAFWPSLSDWSIDGWDQWWHSLMSYDPHYIDLRKPPGEPLVPFYIGEWDFQLYHTGDSLSRTQFRGVTGYAVTYLHDANDKELRGHNVVDSEMMYLWNQKFNPWDLTDAASKQTLRWVEYKPIGATTLTTKMAPCVFLTDAQWDDYNMWADKVELMSTGALLHRNPWLVQYTVTQDNETGALTFHGLPSTVVCKITYSTYPNGRYEWGEVGRDAATVDSAGLSMVTEAFAYAYIDYGIAGADMWNPTVANQMPSIMSKTPAPPFGTGDTKADYKDSLGRAALVDDWCTSWPVTSSNIIGVGGPLANVLAYYTNDLTTAMYGLPQYAGGSVYSGAIVPVTCWNRGWPIPNAGVWNTYTNPIDDSVGYAVISSTIDINGTLVFMVWGNYGRDTYYASAWMHGYQYNINGALKTFAPGLLTLKELQHGVNSIVLKISYTDPKHPTFSIVESLGTISENILHDP
jgi:hypothetical protein